VGGKWAANFVPDLCGLVRGKRRRPEVVVRLQWRLAELRATSGAVGRFIMSRPSTQGAYSPFRSNKDRTMMTGSHDANYGIPSNEPQIVDFIHAPH
jgi:hypothetical protein